MKAVGWQAASSDIAWKQIHFIIRQQPTRQLTLVHKSGNQKRETGMWQLITRRVSWYDAINQTSGREILSVSNQKPFIYLFLFAFIVSKSDPWLFFCFVLFSKWFSVSTCPCNRIFSAQANWRKRKSAVCMKFSRSACFCSIKPNSEVRTGDLEALLATWGCSSHFVVTLK